MLNDTPDLHDLHDLLDRPLPGEPLAAAPGDRLAAGRSALRVRRRRQAGLVAGSLALGTALVLAAGPLGGAGNGVAHDPANDSVPVASEAGQAEPTPTVTPIDGPPVLRVVDVLSRGSARRDQLNQAYTDCLVDHGAPTLDPAASATAVSDAAVSRDRGVTLASPVPEGPRTACASLEPAFPPVLLAVSNPTFAAQAQDYVGCLRDHGEWVRLLNDDNLDWTYRAGHSVPDDNAQVENGCLVQVFGSD